MQIKNSQLILRIILSIVFFVSAFTKLIAPGVLEIILVEHGIVAARENAAVFVRLLIALEFSFALLLLQNNYLRKIVLPGVILFLTGFTIYLLYAVLIIKDSRNCGCFGAALQMSPIESIIKNIFLLAAAVYLFVKAKNNVNKIILPLVLFLVAFPIVFLFAPIRDNKDFLFKKYTEFEGAGRVDLADGEKLVILMTLECEDCQKLANEIVVLKKRYSIPEIYVLFFKEGDFTYEKFKEKTGFAPAYKILPGEEFFELIGTNPPRCYRLKNGKILEFWDKDIKNKLEKSYLPL